MSTTQPPEPPAMTPIPSPTSAPPESPTEVSDPFKLYEFSAKQVSDSRASFERYYKITLSAIGIVSTVIVGGFYFLIGREYKDIETSVRQQAETHFEALDQETRTKIQARLDQEFSTEEMQKLIKQSAVEQVDSAVTASLDQELSSLRQKNDSTRSDVDKYLMPRVLTAKQKADLKVYLSTHKPFGFIFVRYVVNDPEAEDYAYQLAEAFKEGGWDSVAALDVVQLRVTPPRFPGAEISEDTPTHYVTSPAQQQNLQALGGALAAGNITTFQSGALAQSYSLYVYVGPRPLALSGKVTATRDNSCSVAALSTFLSSCLGCESKPKVR